MGMRKNGILLVIVIISVVLLVSGKQKRPDDYIDLGEIMIDFNQGYAVEFPLPYTKPEGVTVIPIRDRECIIIHMITADGRKVRPQRQYFKYFMAAVERDRLNVQLAGEEQEMEYAMMMGWFPKKSADGEPPSLRYRSWTGKNILETLGDEDFYIKYGCKEVFINYSIRFSLWDTSSSKWEFIEMYESEPRTARIGLIWPEL